MREDFKQITEGLDEALREILALHPAWLEDQTFVDEVKIDGRQCMSVRFVSGERGAAWMAIDLTNLNQEVEVELDATGIGDLAERLPDTVWLKVVKQWPAAIGGTPVVRIRGGRRDVLRVVLDNWGQQLFEDVTFEQLTVKK